MATDNSILKLEILPEQTHKAFLYLAKQEWLATDEWYLAGGTALALQMGHRLSVDLDFFTTLDDFDIQDILNHLSSQDWSISLREKGTLYGELFGTKISFIAYPYFVSDQPYIRYHTINLLDAKDIAVMKIMAISQRGKKRDFVDLYWYIYNREPLLNILRRLDKQYPNIQHNYHHIFKSLTYFEEAELDPEPQLLFDLSWDTIKKYFLEVVPQLAKQLL